MDKKNLKQEENLNDRENLSDSKIDEMTDRDKKILRILCTKCKIQRVLKKMSQSRS